MNEQPNNIVPIERGKEIQINNIKILIEKKLDKLRLLLARLNEKYELAQQFGDSDEVHDLLGMVIDVEASIEQGEQLSMEADQNSGELTRKLLERQWQDEDKKD